MRLATIKLDDDAVRIAFGGGYADARARLDQASVPPPA